MYDTYFVCMYLCVYVCVCVDIDVCTRARALSHTSAPVCVLPRGTRAAVTVSSAAHPAHRLVIRQHVHAYIVHVYVDAPGTN